MRHDGISSVGSAPPSWSGRACVAAVALGVILGFGFGGCSGGPADRTGFLSTYDNLEGDAAANYVAPGLARYGRFVVDPVAIDIPADLPEPEAQARRDLARYTQEAVEGRLAEGYAVVSEPVPGTARVRLAITNITRPVALLNLHPGTKLTGAGLGGASIEGEIVDAGTGEQLLAIVEARRGSQMEFDTFDEYDDARDAADGWADWIKRSVDAAHGG